MAKYKNRTVKLNKPFRTPGKSKKFAVYVRNRRTKNVQIVRFGDPNMSIRHGATLRKVRGQKSLAPVYWAVRSWR